MRGEVFIVCFCVCNMVACLLAIAGQFKFLVDDQETVAEEGGSENER